MGCSAKPATVNLMLSPSTPTYLGARQNYAVSKMIGSNEADLTHPYLSSGNQYLGQRLLLLTRFTPSHPLIKRAK
jgi:hypothetical protein